MTDRINIIEALPDLYQSMRSWADDVAKAAANAGVDRLLVELVKIRASQINGCAFCLDMHNADAVKLGENPRRLFVLDAWRETELFTDQERAALELTEHVTRLSQTQGVPDDVYERATAAFTEDQYSAVLWMILVINSWNRIAVPSHTKLPRRAK
ncbi:MAG: carboxymuconolactone decarboxylase family protein [Actinophytocola sp.]|uniref:carboxymuconolactone decarboxylase family protein n=1 Tax=Actinophytocola sp. TaxID=1872138 RepID=UPI0013259B08|nr:carboxymuconolactone decarboxylase family protein [Actinophytocola sp.]MPZ84314.1 carboxymuconolactone decarboxylase family protein [Actinophytocola sp.]